MSKYRKTCVELVQSKMEKSGDMCTHSFHRVYAIDQFTELFRAIKPFFQTIIRVLYTCLSTVKSSDLTDYHRFLSSLSTPPITTTTTYISNKGAIT